MSDDPEKLIKAADLAEVTVGRIGSGIRLPAAIAKLRQRPSTEAELAEVRAKAKAALEAMTDEEEEAILGGALTDPDNPPLEEILDRAERKRLGRPPLPRTKRSVHLRIDQEVVDFFVAGGPGWQTRMNEALRKAAGLK